MSKEFEVLTKEFWYKKNTFWIASKRIRYTGAIVLVYPNPLIGRLIRNFQLKLYLTTQDQWSFTYLLLNTISGWSFILRTRLDTSETLKRGFTQWQEQFPCLEKVDIRFRVNALDGFYCTHAQNMKLQTEDLFSKTEVVFKAKHVEVSAICTCAQHIRVAFLEDMVEAMMTKSETQ